MNDTIDRFAGKYMFLSNFYPVDVTYDCDVYRSVEHAYQAAKTLNLQERKMIANLRYPGQAKRAAKHITIRSDWATPSHGLRLHTMYDLLLQKFAYPDLRVQLLETQNSTLVERNTWGDTFWGVCNGVGHNNLGVLLMNIRSYYQSIKD